MKGMVEKDFDEGLASLDKLAPSVNIQPSGKIVETIISEIKDMNIIQIETSANFSNVAEKMGELYERISKKIEENSQELINAIIKLKPSTAKGTYVKGIHMASSMSPSIAIETKSLLN